MIYQPKLNKYRSSLTCLAVAVACSVTPVANGAGFGLKEQSAYGQGSSFAGVAAGGAISTSFWNPANFSEVGDTLEYEVMGSIIDAESDIRTTGTSSFLYAGLRETGDTGKTALLPAAYFSGRLNKKTAWGVALTAPYGLGSEADRGTRSQYVALKTEAQSLNVSPTITYETAPGFNVGFGLQLQNFEAELTQALPVGAATRTFSANDPILQIIGDDSGSAGFTLGFNYQNDMTSFGVGYRSSIDHTLSGDFNVGALGVSVPVSLDIETPAKLSLGVKHKLNSKWELAATHNRTDWSSVGTVPVIADQTGSILVFNGRPVALPFNYVDTSFTSVGADYAYSDSTTVRFGLGLDETVSTDITRTTRTPDTDRYWLSFGASHKLSKGTLDWGFTRVFLSEDADINIVPGHVAFTGLPYTGVADVNVNILSVSYKNTF